MILMEKFRQQTGLRISPHVHVIVKQAVVQVICLVQVPVTTRARVRVASVLSHICKNFLRLGADSLQGLTHVKPDVFPLLKPRSSGIHKLPAKSRQSI